MLNINLAPEAVAWLKAILSTEEAEGACFRLREFKVGSCWSRNFQILLRLSMDERDEEDIACEVESLPFVMNRDLADIYGSSFRVAVEHGKGAALTVIREKG